MGQMRTVPTRDIVHWSVTCFLTGSYVSVLESVQLAKTSDTTDQLQQYLAYILRERVIRSPLTDDKRQQPKTPLIKLN